MALHSLRAESTSKYRLGGPSGREVEEVLGHFIDPTYAYRFGPRQHAVILGLLELDEGRVVKKGTYWPDLSEPLPQVRLEAVADPERGTIEFAASGLARAARFELVSGRAADNYIDVVPRGEPDTVAMDSQDPVRGYIAAENAPDGSRIAVSSPEGR